MKTYNKKKERIAYLDTLRGFTMLLVIWHHVSDYAFGLKIEDSFISEVMIAFRMPMFFFISGFIAFKPIKCWSFDYFIQRLHKKAMVQLIPTIIFSSAGGLLLAKSSIYELGNYFHDGFPGFWWFTVALFIMFIMYYTASIIAHYVAKWTLFPLLLILAILLMIFKSHFQQPGFFQWFAFPGIARFFIFFVFGLYCQYLGSTYYKVIINKYIITACIVTSCIMLYISYSYDLDLSHDLKAILRTSIGFPSLLIIFSLFYQQQDYWASNNRLSRLMKFIGRRTLDLYMLHFFFIPQMFYLNKYIVGTSQTVIQLFIIGFVTIGVAFVCLITSMILRTSPILSKYLFGQPSKKKEFNSINY